MGGIRTSLTNEVTIFHADGTVEPLPFHGMSGYPYREDEAYPDDAAHREYRAQWNTRPGRLLEWDLTRPGS